MRRGFGAIFFFRIGIGVRGRHDSVAAFAIEAFRRQEHFVFVFWSLFVLSRVDQIIAMVDRLEDVDDLSRLTRLFAPGNPRKPKSDVSNKQAPARRRLTV